SIVSHGDLRFLILDCPSDSTLPSVIKILTKEGVTDVVRVCEPTYATDPLTSLGIQVHDLSFKDGASLRSATSTDSTDHPPPPSHAHGTSSMSTSTSSQPPHPPAPTTIAVHCVAGLGRAPVLIAVALIEHGMSPLDAIEYVRARRRGAFNTTQVKYLDAYK
ncbi:protein-tyrosine phosphatase-like protein, partial [Catenaria anguillulae PL171]